MIHLTEALAEEIIQIDNIAFGECDYQSGDEWRALVTEAEALIGEESSYTSWRRRTA